MEIKLNSFKQFFRALKLFGKRIKSKFIKKAEVSEKREINFRSFKILFISGVLIFILVIFLLPNEQEIEFTQKIVHSSEDQSDSPKVQNSETNVGRANDLWGSNSIGSMRATQSSSGNSVNYNTSMIVGSKNGNAKTQLQAGIRIPIQILDKFIVSQESVPILGESLFETRTDSGLTLPAGTRFYGEASFQKGSDRAVVNFRQISLPSGEIRTIGGMAMGKDGQVGIHGSVSSDGSKNAMGSIITTFVAGYASGSMETDIMGQSKGGIENGLKAAVAATAKEKANSFGEKLKTQREWIEVSEGAECDVLLNESMNLQKMDGE